MKDRRKVGDKVADRVTKIIGSWRFIIVQSIILSCWIVLNSVAWFQHWDVYPFILMNLTLSFQAAYTAPIIMMSQNRQAEKDRRMVEQDYETNQRSESELYKQTNELNKQTMELYKQTQILIEMFHTKKPDGTSDHNGTH